MSPLKHVLLPILHCSDLAENRSLPEPFLVYGKYLQPEELFGKPAGNPSKHDFAQEEEYKGCIPDGFPSQSDIWGVPAQNGTWLVGAENQAESSLLPKVGVGE